MFIGFLPPTKELPIVTLSALISPEFSNYFLKSPRDISENKQKGPQGAASVPLEESNVHPFSFFNWF